MIFVDNIDGSFKPTDDFDNNTIIFFYDTDLNKFDICLKLMYDTSLKVTLVTEYSSKQEDNKPKKLFEYELSGQNEFEFCLNDFRGFEDSSQKEFYITLSVKGDKGWSENFSIKYFSKTKVINREEELLPYLLNWKHDSFKFDKYLSSTFPSKSFTKNDESKLLTFESKLY
jgi:hypothetical protein